MLWLADMIFLNYRIIGWCQNECWSFYDFGTLNIHTPIAMADRLLFLEIRIKLTQIFATLDLT